MSCCAESLSHVQLFVTPWIIQSKEFSRPEYCNGQPYPSPGDLPYPQIEPRSPALQANSLPAEPQGKPKNTGVGSLSLLWWNFRTQGSNRGLLHCRWIFLPTEIGIEYHKTEVKVLTAWVLIWSSGSSSKFISVVRILFVALVGLRSPFPCCLLLGKSSAP